MPDVSDQPDLFYERGGVDGVRRYIYSLDPCGRNPGMHLLLLFRQKECCGDIDADDRRNLSGICDAVAGSAVGF